MKITYYDEILIQVNDLMAKDEFDQAKIILEEELNQPYIPEKYEVSFLKLYKETILNLKTDDNFAKNKTVIINNLFSHNNDLKVESVMNIADVELDSQDLEFINIFFKNESDMILKTLLFQIMISKNINYNFDFRNSSFDFKLNPSETPSLNEFYNKNIINKRIYDETFKEPSLKIMCESLLDRVLLKTFPKLLPDTPEKIASEIVGYCRSKLYTNINYPKGHFSFLENIVNENFLSVKN